MCGYAGGHVKDPNYYQVCTGSTGHAEVVRLTFDPNKVELDQLLEIFWTIHDPTTLNQQGADMGTEYRSVILMESSDQHGVVEESLRLARKLWGDGITTEVDMANEFYPAEEEHQNYFNKYPESAYCWIVINPKLEQLRLKHAYLMA